MAMTVVDQTLVWLGGLADNTEGGVLNLARQIAALRTTAVTAIGCRLCNAIRDLRLQHRELKLERIQGDLLDSQRQLNMALGAGRNYLARLRAVILAYQPRRYVPMPLDFPRMSPIFDHMGIDGDAVRDVLENELDVTDLTSQRLMDRIPQWSHNPH
jgi:hypothetical protein